MKKLIGRLNDWRLERLIALYRREFKAAITGGRKDEARAIWTVLGHAIGHRSPEQVARMELRRGLR